MLKAIARIVYGLLGIGILGYTGWLWLVGGASVLIMIGGFVAVAVLTLIYCIFEGLVLNREV